MIFQQRSFDNTKTQYIFRNHNIKVQNHINNSIKKVLKYKNLVID